MGYHYYSIIPVPSLMEDVKRKRVEFWCARPADSDFESRPFVFADKSMIAQDLNIWRKKGEDIPEQASEKRAHEVSVMICGGIATQFRTRLLKCPGRVNATTYMEMVGNGAVFQQYICTFDADRC
jgi:hypothetical protein